MHVEEFPFDMVTVQYVSQGTMKPWNMNDDSVHGQYVDIKIIDIVEHATALLFISF